MRFKATFRDGVHTRIGELISIILREKKDCFLRVQLSQTEWYVAPEELGAVEQYPVYLSLVISKGFSTYRIESAQDNVINIYVSGKMLMRSLLNAKGSRNMEIKLTKTVDQRPCFNFKAELPGCQGAIMYQAQVEVTVLEACASLKLPRLSEPAFQVEIPVKRLSNWLEKMRSMFIDMVDFRVERKTEDKASVSISTKREDIGLDLQAQFLELQMVKNGKTHPPPPFHEVRRLPLKSLHAFVFAHLNVALYGPHMAGFIDNRAVSLYTPLRDELGYFISYTFSGLD
eukprot:GEMP01044689.1.p1 GENE.GEMP01044689.1~~GEMP01044689.1.p1  ORF type:complete len:326 (+),score=35.87 GEMP01044689.1:123-980(+)